MIIDFHEGNANRASISYNDDEGRTHIIDPVIVYGDGKRGCRDFFANIWGSLLECCDRAVKVTDHKHRTFYVNIISLGEKILVDGDKPDDEKTVKAAARRFVTDTTPERASLIIDERARRAQAEMANRVRGREKEVELKDAETAAASRRAAEEAAAKYASREAEDKVGEEIAKLAAESDDRREQSSAKENLIYFHSVLQGDGVGKKLEIFGYRLANVRSVQEGREVCKELREYVATIPPEIQREINDIYLPPINYSYELIDKEVIINPHRCSNFRMLDTIKHSAVEESREEIGRYTALGEQCKLLFKNMRTIVKRFGREF